MTEDAARRLSSIELLRLVENRGTLGTWTWDVRRAEFTWSAGLFRLLGLDPVAERPSYERFVAIVHPADRHHFTETGGLLSDSPSLERRFRIIRPDGLQRWLASHRESVFGPNGELRQLVGVIIDVTCHEVNRQRSDAMTMSIRAMSDMLGFVSILRMTLSGDAVEAFGWQEVTGQTEQDLVGWGWLGAVDGEDAQHLQATIQRALATRQTFTETVRLRLVDGSIRKVEATGLPVGGHDGGGPNWVCVVLPSDARPDGARTSSVSGRHIQAARAFLDWTAQDLADRSGVSLSTVRRIESRGTETVRGASVDVVRRTLEDAGISFPEVPDGRLGLTYDAAVTERAARN